MKAAVFQSPGHIAVMEVPTPEIGPSEVLVKVGACGICGTDLRIASGEFFARYPVIPGHEFCGEIVEVGREVAHLRPGQWVAINPNTPCRHCQFCYRGQFHLCDTMISCGVTYDGGFAEYCKVAGDLALPVPTQGEDPHRFPPSGEWGLSPLALYAMMEPVSCCLHGIDLAGIVPGDRVVILGGGSIGLILMQIARHAGATQLIVSEPKAHKRALAEQLGADATLDPFALGEGLTAAVRDMTEGGADVVIEAAGLPATAQAALPLARKGGTVLFFGVCPQDLDIPIKPYDIYHYEITIKGAFTNPLTDSRAMQLLASARVQVAPLITHVFSLDQLVAGLRAVRCGETVKALVVP